MGSNAYSVIGIITGICVVAGFIIAYVQLKSYVRDSMKKGSEDAASAAASEWRNLSDAKTGTIEELKGKIEVLEAKVKDLTNQNDLQMNQIDTLQKKIEGMMDINKVGEVIEMAVKHFNDRMDVQERKLEIMLEVMKASNPVTIVK